MVEPDGPQMTIFEVRVLHAGQLGLQRGTINI